MQPYPVGFVQQPLGGVFIAQQPPQLSMQPGLVGNLPQSSGTFDRHVMHPSMSEGAIHRARDQRLSPLTQEPARVRQSLSSSRLSDSGESSYFSSSSPQVMESSLLPQIKSIPNTEKRMSRLDISVMQLTDDLREMENKINEILIDDPQFFQNHEYQTLMRKKRKHMQEKRELQKYKAELEKETANNVADETHKVSEDTLRNRLSEVSLTDVPNVISGYAAFVTPQGPPATSVPLSLATVLSQSEHGRYYPPNTGTPPTTGVSGQMSATPPQLGLESLSGETTEEAIRRLLVLGNSPFANKTSTPRNSSNPVSMAVSYPPEIDKTLPQKAGQPQNLNLNIPNIPAQPNKSCDDTKQVQIADVDQTEDCKWECEHCTYQNSFASKACEICFKTSSKLKVMKTGEKTVEVPEPESPSPAVHGPVEACEHCTYDNPVGSKVCAMCNKSQSKYQRRDSLKTNVGSPPEKSSRSVAEEVAVAGAVVGAAVASPQGCGAKVPAEPTHPAKVGQLIDEEQDRVSGGMVITQPPEKIKGGI